MSPSLKVDESGGPEFEGTAPTATAPRESRQLIVPAYTVIAALYCATFAIVFQFVRPIPILGLVHWVAFFAVVANYLAYLWLHQERLATHIILGAGTLVVTSLFATGGWDGSGMLWSFAYLPYSFFLAKRKDAYFWVGALIAITSTLSLLDALGRFDLPYGPATQLNYFLALAVFSGCMFLFKFTVERNEALVQQSTEAIARAEIMKAATQSEVKRLEEQTRFKTQFLNMAAHELATPMTPIKLQIHMMKNGMIDSLTPRQERTVQVIDRNVERLGRLVQDLLDAAKLQAGRLQYRPQDVDLVPIIEETIEALADTARLAGVKLSAHLPARVVVEGDPGRLSQVFFNLVNNALKFTPRDGSVTVDADVQGPRCEVRVTDTGIGMEPDQIARLFQPFTQVHKDMAVSVGGTGLGLYISKGIVETHGGTMGARSDGAGKGSTFWVNLPVLARASISNTMPEARSIPIG